MASSEHVVPPSLDGERCDSALVALELAPSRAAAARLLADGAVLVGGRAARKSSRVRTGDVLSIEETDDEPPAATAAPPEITIVHEDDDLIVVDKPAGLVVHPGPGHRSGTLAQQLAGRAGGGEAGRAGIVHRLDKDTSGLLVVARNEETLRSLQSALRRREVARGYIALVCGSPESASGTIDAPLGRDHRDPERISVVGGGREAVTHFELCEQLPAHALLDLQLESGRTHQIRVHLKAIGLPVAGDPKYGVGGDLGLSRQFLHAARLGFTHPTSGAPLSFSSELPVDLRDALERARLER